MSLAALIGKKGAAAPLTDAAPASVLESAFAFKANPVPAPRAAPVLKQTRPGVVAEDSDDSDDG
jgi:hypothetical protein